MPGADFKSVGGRLEPAPVGSIPTRLRQIINEIKAARGVDPLRAALSFCPVAPSFFSQVHGEADITGFLLSDADIAERHRRSRVIQDFLNHRQVMAVLVGVIGKSLP